MLILRGFKTIMYLKVFDEVLVFFYILLCSTYSSGALPVATHHRQIQSFQKKTPTICRAQTQISS